MPAGPAAPSRIVWEHTRGRYSCMQCAFSTASRPAMTRHLEDHRPVGPGAPAPGQPRPEEPPAGKAGLGGGMRDGRGQLLAPPSRLHKGRGLSPGPASFPVQRQEWGLDSGHAPFVRRQFPCGRSLSLGPAPVLLRPRPADPAAAAADSRWGMSSVLAALRPAPGSGSERWTDCVV